MLQQNSARLGTRLPALRPDGAGPPCPSSRCRSCWPCQASAPLPPALSVRDFAACTTCRALTPPNLRRSPVSRRRAPPRWNSCCTPLCQPRTAATRERCGSGIFKREKAALLYLRARSILKLWWTAQPEEADALIEKDGRKTG